VVLNGVVITTPWEWHKPILAIGALEASLNIFTTNYIGNFIAGSLGCCGLTEDTMPML